MNTLLLLVSLVRVQANTAKNPASFWWKTTKCSWQQTRICKTNCIAFCYSMKRKWWNSMVQLPAGHINSSSRSWTFIILFIPQSDLEDHFSHQIMHISSVKPQSHSFSVFLILCCFSPLFSRFFLRSLNDFWERSSNKWGGLRGYC